MYYILLILAILLSKSFNRHYNIPPLFSILSKFMPIFYAHCLEVFRHSINLPLPGTSWSFSRRFPVRRSFNSLLRICPSHWIVLPLMKLVTGARFIISCSSLLNLLRQHLTFASKTGPQILNISCS